jgi:hypothetical protein
VKAMLTNFVPDIVYKSLILNMAMVRIFEMMSDNFNEGKISTYEICSSSRENATLTNTKGGDKISLQGV